MPSRGAGCIETAHCPLFIADLPPTIIRVRSLSSCAQQKPELNAAVESQVSTARFGAPGFYDFVVTCIAILLSAVWCWRWKSGTGAVTVIMFWESGDQCWSTKRRGRRCGCVELRSVRWPQAVWVRGTHSPKSAASGAASIVGVRGVRNWKVGASPRQHDLSG